MYRESKKVEQLSCENLEKICVLDERADTAKRFTFYDIVTAITVSATSLDTILASASGAVYYWIDLQLPSASDIERVGRRHGIHQLTIESIIHQSQQERCIFCTQYQYFVLEASGNNSKANVYSVVFENCILTFHFEEMPEIARLQEEVSKMGKFMITTPAWINLVLICSILETQFDVIADTERHIRALNNEVTRTTYECTDLESTISNIAANISAFVWVLGSKLAILKAMAKQLETKEPLVHYITIPSRYPSQMTCKVVVDERGSTYPGIAIHLEELQNRITHAMQSLEQMDKFLSLTHANFLAKISIKLAKASNDTNLVIGRLTTFATVLLPMNLVTGLWGMNIKVPGEDNDSLVYFFWILSGLAILAMVLLTLARKSNLI